MFKIRRIPPGAEIELFGARWTLYLYRSPYCGYNGRRIVLRRNARANSYRYARKFLGLGRWDALVTWLEWRGEQD